MLGKSYDILHFYSRCITETIRKIGYANSCIFFKNFQLSYSIFFFRNSNSKTIFFLDRNVLQFSKNLQKDSPKMVPKYSHINLTND